MTRLRIRERKNVKFVKFKKITTRTVLLNNNDHDLENPFRAVKGNGIGLIIMTTILKITKLVQVPFETTRVSPTRIANSVASSTTASARIRSREGGEGEQVIFAIVGQKSRAPPPLPWLAAKLIERLKEKLRQTRGRARSWPSPSSRRVLRMLLYVTGNKSLCRAAYTNRPTDHRPKEFSKLSTKACVKGNREPRPDIVHVYSFNINPNSNRLCLEHHSGYHLPSLVGTGFETLGEGLEGEETLRKIKNLVTELEKNDRSFFQGG